jgi:hypothetical protein
MPSVVFLVLLCCMSLTLDVIRLNVAMLSVVFLLLLCCIAECRVFCIVMLHVTYVESLRKELLSRINRIITEDHFVKHMNTTRIFTIHTSLKLFTIDNQKF